MCLYNVTDSGGEGHGYVHPQENCSHGHAVMVRHGGRDSVYHPTSLGLGYLGQMLNRRPQLVLHHVLALWLLLCPVARGCLSPHPTPAAPLVMLFMDQVMYLGVHERGEN